MVTKRLYRSRKNRMIAGVCAGIAEYFYVDPTVIRVGWVIITAFGVLPGVIAYIICALIMPENPEEIG